MIHIPMKTTNSITEYIKGNQLRKNAKWLIRDGEWLFEMQNGIWGRKNYLMSSTPSTNTLSLMTRELILIKRKSDERISTTNTKYLRN